MCFSLILCTLNRTKEVEAFLQSLFSQTYQNFEVIMIDQNHDDRLVSIVEKYQDDFKLIHLRSEKGLSLARNVGLRYATGTILAFPDDDCTYPPRLLENIQKFFSTEKYAIMMGKTIDKTTGRVAAGKAVHESQKLSCFHFLGSSTTMFFNLNFIDKQEIYFDEDFGLGARFGSGEEEELMVRVLQNGYEGFYNPQVNFVYHPPSDLDFSDLERAKSRAQGLGAMIAKHLLSMCGVFYLVKYALVHPVVRIMISATRGDMHSLKYHKVRLSGIVQGMIDYTIMIRKKS